MATLFRYQGNVSNISQLSHDINLNFVQERELERRCGTKPYIAPEVLLRPYRAEPADIWSTGVVLVTLLAGGKILCLILHEKELIASADKNKELRAIFGDLAV